MTASGFQGSSPVADSCSRVDGQVPIRHPRAVRSPIAPICIAATFCLTACQDDDLQANTDGLTTGDDESTSTTTTTTTTSTPPTSTTETSGDVDPTTTTTTSSTSTGEPDDSSSGDPPDRTTGEPDVCTDQPEGTYKDCLAGEMCDGDSLGCIVDDVNNPSLGICSLSCQDDCDCFADPGDGNAASRCLPLLEGGEKACALDCSGGESCPSGTVCVPQVGICVYEAVEQQADLLLGYFYLADHVLAPGAPTQMNFEIVNAGAAGVAFEVALRVVVSKNVVFGDDDDVIVWSNFYLLDIGPGEAQGYDAGIQIPEQLFDGEYHVGMAVDVAEDITESDETNNSLFDPDQLVIIGNPEPGTTDLNIASAIAAAHQVLQGDGTSFDLQIKNLAAGNVPAYSVDLYYSQDPVITPADTKICTFNDVDGLAGNAEEALLIECAVPPLVGDYYFGAIVDPADALDEIDEGNNVASDPVLVTIGAPDVDLVMGAVSIDDITVDTGQLVTLSATVSNGGNDPSAAFGVSFYLSSDANITAADKLVCATAVDAGLPAGQQTVVSPQCAIPAVASGAYWLGAIADPAAAITETDETNNDGAAGAQVQVKAPDVDLAYELHWDDAALPPNPGDVLTFHLQIRNNGTAASPAKFDANIHYSTDDSITLLDAKACTVSVGPVPAKTITEFEFQCTVPQLAPAWYYSGVIIDPGNAVPETNENNNWGSAVNPEPID
jgi:hypothetical protein